MYLFDLSRITYMDSIDHKYLLALSYLYYYLNFQHRKRVFVCLYHPAIPKNFQDVAVSQFPLNIHLSVCEISPLFCRSLAGETWILNWKVRCLNLRRVGERIFQVFCCHNSNFSPIIQVFNERRWGLKKNICIIWARLKYHMKCFSPFRPQSTFFFIICNW